MIQHVKDREPSAVATSPSSGHLGLVVYLWAPQLQNEWLVERLGPAVEEARESQDLRWLWFDRFDARGPHLFVCVTPHEGRLPVLRSALATALDGAWLENAGEMMTEVVDIEEARQRHLACGGKAQNEIDRREGLGEPGSAVSFVHPAEGYPFFHTRDVPAAEELWDLWDRLTAWTLKCLEATEGRVPTGAAARWLASVDLELESAGVDRARYWELHASTLVPLRPGTGNERGPTRLGEQNLATCRRIWRQTRDDGPLWSPVRRLIEKVLLDPAYPSASGRALLREIIHCTLKQLGLPIRQQLPLVHFAWERARAPGGDVE